MVRCWEAINSVRIRMALTSSTMLWLKMGRGKVTVWEGWRAISCSHKKVHCEQKPVPTVQLGSEDKQQHRMAIGLKRWDLLAVTFVVSRESRPSRNLSTIHTVIISVGLKSAWMKIIRCRCCYWQEIQIFRQMHATFPPNSLLPCHYHNSMFASKDYYNILPSENLFSFFLQVWLLLK